MPGLSSISGLGDGNGTLLLEASPRREAVTTSSESDSEVVAMVVETASRAEGERFIRLDGEDVSASR